MTKSKAFRLTAISVASSMAMIASNAQAAWEACAPSFGCAMVSNVCRAPSGDYWIYPVEDAEPIGYPCRVLSTGEYGTVTPN